MLPSIVCSSARCAVITVDISSVPKRPGQKCLQARCGGKICFSPPPPCSLAED
jgi:hypothetical protein